MQNDEPNKPVPIPDEVLKDPYSWYNIDKTRRSMAIVFGTIILATLIVCAWATASDEKHVPAKPKGTAAAEPFTDLPQSIEVTPTPVENMT